MSVVKAGQKGVTHYDPSKFCRGYNLFSPLGDFQHWLMDMEGRFVHRWEVKYDPALHGYLLPNGNLIHAGKLKSREELGLGWTVEFSGVNGIIQELDWDSNVVWEMEVPLGAHDFMVLPNDHIIYIAWEKKGVVPDKIAAKVKGGRPGTECNGKIWSDVLVEIDRDGNRIWEWVAWEHLDPEIDSICPLENRSQWPYLNALWLCRDGNIIMSCRYLNQITKIDYKNKTGKVIGRYLKNKVFHQHDCRELENGNITLYDNGTHRHVYGPDYSTVLEFDPKTEEIVWQYIADPPSDFFSPHSGGCEKQPNGNYVVIETDKGRMFEVTPDKEIAWEYVYPRYITHLARFTNMIWRVHRYTPDFPGLKGKDLDPERYAWINRIWGPDAFAKDIKPCIF